jgi:hypothetical protein
VPTDAEEALDLRICSEREGGRVGAGFGLWARWLQLRWMDRESREMLREERRQNGFFTSPLPRVNDDG